MADNIASAVVLSGASGSVDGDTTGYTLESGEGALLYDAAGALGFGGGRSAWHKFTVPADGDYSFYTSYTDDTYAGSGLADSLLIILDDSNFATANVLGWNDDAAPPFRGLWSQVDLIGLITGQVLYISVDGYNGDATDFGGYDINNTSAGAFRLHWGAPPPVPGPPIIVTGIADGAIDLHGTVNPQGVSTDWRFQYGTTTGYGSLTPSQNLGLTDYTEHAVLEHLSSVGLGLSSYTTYHFRLRAQNSFRIVVGADATFVTGNLDPPDVRNQTIITIAPTSVTADFEINPYGMLAEYWIQVQRLSTGTSIYSPHISDGSGSSWVGVESIATGLNSNTAYRVRANVQTVNGIAQTAWINFTTPLSVKFALCPPDITDLFTGAECSTPSAWYGDLRTFNNQVGALNKNVINRLINTYGTLGPTTGELSADISIQLAVVDGKQDIGILDPGAFPPNGYFVRSNATIGKVQIIRLDGGVETVLVEAAQTFSNGDYLGFRYDRSITRISAYRKPAAGGWGTPLISAIDSTYTTSSYDMCYYIGQSTLVGPPSIDSSLLFDLSTYGDSGSSAAIFPPFSCPNNTPKYVWFNARWRPDQFISGGTPNIPVLQCPVWYLELTVFPHGRIDCYNDVFKIGDDDSIESIYEFGDTFTGPAAIPFYPTRDYFHNYDNIDARLGGFYVYDTDVAYKAYDAIHSSLDSIITAFATEGAYKLASIDPTSGFVSYGGFLPVKKSIGRLDNFSVSYEHCAPSIIPIVSFSSIRQEELRTVN